MRNVCRIVTINRNLIHLTNAYFNKHYLILAIKGRLLQLNPISYAKQCIKNEI